MVGILVIGVALGLQKGGKKIKEKREERKARKASLVKSAAVHYSQRHRLQRQAAAAREPAELITSGMVHGHSICRDSRLERKSGEAQGEQQRRSFSSERACKENMSPTYEEAMRDD